MMSAPRPGSRPHAIRSITGGGAFTSRHCGKTPGVMIESTLPQAPEEKAKAILEQSKTQKLIGKMTNFTRKGARQIHYVMLAAGVITHNGQPVRMTFDKIAATHWQPA